MQNKFNLTSSLGYLEYSNQSMFVNVIAVHFHCSFSLGCTLDCLSRNFELQISEYILSYWSYQHERLKVVPFKITHSVSVQSQKMSKHNCCAFKIYNNIHFYQIFISVNKAHNNTKTLRNTMMQYVQNNMRLLLLNSNIQPEAYINIL